MLVAGDFDAVINGCVVNEVVIPLDVDIEGVFMPLVVAVLDNFPEGTEVFTAVGMVLIALEVFDLEIADVTETEGALKVVTGTGADLRACTGVFEADERLDLVDGKVGGGGRDVLGKPVTGEENRP